MHLFMMMEKHNAFGGKIIAQHYQGILPDVNVTNIHIHLYTKKLLLYNNYIYIPHFLLIILKPLSSIFFLSFFFHHQTFKKIS